MEKGVKFFFKAILFDLDGVLIDSSDAWWFSVNKTLEKFGKRKVTKEEFLNIYWGPHLRETFKKIGLGKDAVEDCNEEYYNFIDKIKVFPEVKKVLSTLKPKFKIGLVTNTPRKNTISALDKFSLTAYFDMIVGGDEVEKGKPYPDIILKACKLLKVEPKETILVGDTKSDVLAGRRAGVFVIGLKVQGGDKKIENLSELLKIFKLLN
jgi:HAD superfamily hydrolase (TIGR01549 family)